MAKKSKIARNLQKQDCADRYRKKRLELRKIIKSPKSSIDEKMDAQIRLQKLPKLSIGTRVGNRCRVTGRPRGYLRKFQMSRIAFRELAGQGKIPGVTKSSW